MTAQIAERLLYNRKNLRLCNEPLASHPTFKSPFPGGFNSGCWRGYVGHWEIHKDALWLRDVVEPMGDEGRIGVAFPDQPPPILADWFTGGLRATAGKQLEYIHGGYASVYERNLFFGVIQGKILVVETVDTQTSQVTKWGLTPQFERFYGHDEAAFLRQIRSNLDDRTPRLVYADWLEEREDPRAGLLRAECAFAEASDSEREGRQQQAQQAWAKLRDRVWAQIVGIPHRGIISMIPEWAVFREPSLADRLEWSFHATTIG